VYWHGPKERLKDFFKVTFTGLDDGNQELDMGCAGNHATKSMLIFYVSVCFGFSVSVTVHLFDFKRPSYSTTKSFVNVINFLLSEKIERTYSIYNKTTLINTYSHVLQDLTLDEKRLSLIKTSADLLFWVFASTSCSSTP